MATEWKRVQLLLEDDLVKLIDEWRRRQPDLPDRNVAIRTLLRQALSAEGITTGEDRVAE